MKEFTIGPNDAGQRLDRFLAKAVPLLPASLAQKYIRLKRIKRNGARAQRDDRLLEGDVLQLYINDEFFDVPTADNAYLTVAVPRLTVVYEDENLLLVDKQPGIPVHPHDGAEPGRTLIDHILAYLYQKREWRPREEASFTPALCNRIDRNTGGIVIAAKTAEALRVMNQKIKDRELDKRYLAVVEGTPRPASGALKGFLFKDAVQNRVYVTDAPQRAVARRVRAYHRPDASDPRAVRPRGASPARGRKIRQGRPPPKISGALFLPPDLPLHDRRRVARLPQRAQLRRCGRSVRGGILSRLPGSAAKIVKSR